MGCYIPDNELPCVASDGDSLMVDYHITTIQENFANSELSKFVIHESVKKNEKLANMSISLDECIKRLAKEVRVTETRAFVNSTYNGDVVLLFASLFASLVAALVISLVAVAFSSLTPFARRRRR